MGIAIKSTRIAQPWSDDASLPQQLDDLPGFYFLSGFYDLFALGHGPTDTEPDSVCYYHQCVGGQITGWGGKKIQHILEE